MGVKLGWELWSLYEKKFYRQNAHHSQFSIGLQKLNIVILLLSYFNTVDIYNLINLTGYRLIFHEKLIGQDSQNENLLRKWNNV